MRKFPIRADCFAYRNEIGEPECAALNTTLCVTTGRCPFYTERREAEKHAQQARLAAMDKGYYLDSGRYEPRGTN